MFKVRISIVINTLNEEKNLARALQSVRPWADEIVVVDMHSDDRTVEIAREFGANVYFHERAGFVEPARAFAIARATGDWVLTLDADELVPFPLSCRLREIAEADMADVVKLSRLNYVLGAPLMHSGWGPHQDVHMRFFKRSSCRTSSRIHEPLKPEPGARWMEIPYQPGYAIAHYNYLDVADFLDRLNRYTTIEARQAHERGERATPWRALFRAVREFLGRYVRRGGRCDGWRGFYLSLFMGLYRLATFAKLAELGNESAREAVELAYEQDARRLLSEYDKAGAGGDR